MPTDPAGRWNGLRRSELERKPGSELRRSAHPESSGRSTLAPGKGLSRAGWQTRAATRADDRPDTSRAAEEGRTARPPRPRSAAPANRLPAPVRAAVYFREGGVCGICGVRPVESVQHRQTGQMGGDRNPGRHRLSHLLAVCGLGGGSGCHALADGSPDRYVNGWLVRHGEDPAAVPVLYRGRWVLLGDDGTISATAPPPYAGVVLDNRTTGAGLSGTG